MPQTTTPLKPTHEYDTNDGLQCVTSTDDTSDTKQTVTVEVKQDEQLASIQRMVSDNQNRIQNISIGVQFQTFILIVLLIILIFKI